MKKIFSIFCCVLVVFLAACSNNTVHAQELSKRFTAEQVETLAVDDAFVASYNELSANLIKTAYSSDNALISPLSIELAFSMLTNGAVGKTKEELESFLGGMDIETFNKYNKAYVNSIKESEGFSFGVANSIWLKNDEKLSVKDRFLQTNANYYAAQVYSADFDNSTLNDINNWVSDNTNGMIKKIIDKIDKDTVMYLINAICMEAEWQAKFEENEVIDQDFTNLDGSKTQVKMMRSSEYNYISYGNATGFMKKYKGGRFAFLGLLPNEGVSISDFVSSLTGDELKKYFTSTDEKVRIKMPKMKVEYDLNLINTLQKLGVTEVFNPYLANLTDMATYKDANIYISMAKHKTFMEVDTNGTKAAAVTIIAGGVNAAPSEEQPKYVTLDRPFVYGIIDMENKMPIFLGVKDAFNV